MGHGVTQVFLATMTSAGTLTGALNLGRNFEKVYLSVPSMTSNSQIHVQGCETQTGTYRRITHPAINSSTVSTPNDFAIASATTNRIVPIPNGFQYLKIETTATIDGGCLFKLICADGG